MNALIGMMTEARLEGVPWSLDDKSYQCALDLLNEGVINFLHEIITQIFDEFTDALKPLLALIGEILQAVKPLVSEVIHTVTGALKDILSALMPLIHIVKEVLAPIFKVLGEVVRTVFDGLRALLNWFTGGLIDDMNEWADTIQLLDDEQQNELDRLKANKIKISFFMGLPLGFPWCYRYAASLTSLDSSEG